MDCNCKKCSGETPELHEVCWCPDCHEQGYHTDPSEWLSQCGWCEEEDDL